MDATTLDVIVADDGMSGLAAGYLLAARGRSVGVVERQPDDGTAAVSVLSARRLVPLHDLVSSAPVISRRAVTILQPEGGVTVSVASDRLHDTADAVVVVERGRVAAALTAAITDLGGRMLPMASIAMSDATGAIAGFESALGPRHPARCSILGRRDVERLTGVPKAELTVPVWAVGTDWRFALDADVVRERFSLSDATAAEWWLYGDPFDGAHGFGRLRAFGDTVALGMVLPLEEVVERRVSVVELGDRLRRHPYLASLLDEAVATGTTGRTLPLDATPIESCLGDGWVAAPSAPPTDVAPLSTELAMAEEIASAIDDALAASRVTASRLATLPARLGRIWASAGRLPLEPIDAWVDELIGEPSGLVEAARSLAARYGVAG